MQRDLLLEKPAVSGSIRLSPSLIVSGNRLLDSKPQVGTI